ELGSLEEALAAEFRVSVRCLREPDLPEGVRAQVVDKDRRPRWDPTPLTAERVAGFSAPLRDLAELDPAPVPVGR
ncbi:enoyl-CoA hydratase/isomerase family protein, partial [Pseudonocardia pini]|uniref:enoyl-CoA hydratase/isomerase family protein n=1 Tax=Pseudonocardia pini TaxID=2758030 RepID=UPI0015F12239